MTLADLPVRILAQDVTVTPDAAGMPGGALIQQLLNWAQMLALWGSLGAILVGAATYGLAQHGGSYGGANRGKTIAMGGVVVAPMPTPPPIVLALEGLRGATVIVGGRLRIGARIQRGRAG